MSGIYIHIPFCSKKCLYCNFFSLASKKGIEKFADAVCREMEIRGNYLNGECIETIYFGGGTPSQLPANGIKKILDEILKSFPHAESLEVTLEANPDDITPLYLDQLAAAGVNRISLGLQSFFDDDLEYLGRSHNRENALRSLKMILQGPIRETCIDLIYGIPTLNDKKWKQNLKMLTENNIPHISAYALTIEEKTGLSHYIRDFKRLKPDEEQTAHQFEILMDYLEGQGYEQYEISNFCLPGHRSKHNSAYWDGKSYLGIGPSAHSYNGISRQWNVSNLSEYMTSIEKGELSFTIENLSVIDRYNETIMTGFRTSAGVNLTALENEFGKGKTNAFIRLADKYLKMGWMEIRNDYNYVLTRKGRLFADHITSALFLIDDEI